MGNGLDCGAILKKFWQKYWGILKPTSSCWSLLSPGKHWLLYLAILGHWPENMAGSTAFHELGDGFHPAASGVAGQLPAYQAIFDSRHIFTAAILCKNGLLSLLSKNNF